MPPKGFQETRVVGHFSWMQGMSNTETGQKRDMNGAGTGAAVKSDRKWKQLT